MNKLQSIILPDMEEITPLQASYLGGDFIIYRNNQRCKKDLMMKKFSKLHSATYFNAFSLDFWQKKTDIETLALRLYGKGVAQLNIKMESSHFQAKNLLSRIVTLTPEGITIPIGNLRQLASTGIIYFELVTLSDHLIFYGGEYLTSDNPKRDIKLGIIITHFNRKNTLLRTIKRISQYLEHQTLYHGKIKLIIVDNSQNITPEEAGSATVISNKNLGGSGGFARGLLYAEDEGSFSHCLFMDDDGQCEIESITRAFHAAQYSRDEIAISGALLKAEYPAQIYEQGAYFSQAAICSLYQGKDISTPESLLQLEKRRHPINYGAWWFFLFSIKQVKYYPYPFFIRGDDILFSLQNRFHIVALNGIACWGGDFAEKNSPLIQYLSFRGNAIASMIYDRYPILYILGRFFRSMASQLFSYRYDSARALLQSLTDLAKGPNFIKENIDIQAIKEELATKTKIEKAEKINKDIYMIEYPSEEKNKVLHYLKFSLSLLTLNGHLLPDFLLKNQKFIIHQKKGQRANFAAVFRYQRILYENEINTTGYITTMRRKEFFTLAWQAIKLGFNFLLNRQELMKDFRNSSISFTSREFWQKQYDER